MSHSGTSPALVFVHGLLGFDQIRLWPRPISYFRHLRETVAGRGLTAYFTSLPPVGTVAGRAAALDASLQEIPDQRLCLVAHSMGGLDSRYLIQHHDSDRRVGTLVTIGTPHRGTYLAKWLLEGHGLMPWLVRPWTRMALAELTPEACSRFNEAVPDRDDVRYLSFAGARPEGEMPRGFRPWTRMLTREAGENDSQVPVSSARWGEFRGIQRADHLELVGWSLAPADEQRQRPFDDRALFEAILDDLM